MKNIKTYHIAFVLFLLAFAAACTTKKNTFVTRSYHNLTSRYNGYFYAKESMKDARTKVERAYVDDYSQLLPLFQLPNTTETKTCYTDLEKAIKKSTTVIERHAITDKKGVEIAGAVKWIDENFVIIGQAHYYKGEYLSAIEIFDYVIAKYPKFPTRYEAIMWKSRCQVEMGAYSDAESLLDIIANDKACPEKLKPEILLSYANIYLHTGNNDNAIKYLEEAYPLIKKKKYRARYIYILAQLYEQKGDNKKAYDLYAKVIELHPGYDMYFNARLSRARLSGSNSKTRTAAKRELEKMLEDEKNKEYKDQIYYTLAQLEQSSGNRSGALLYYKQSVAASMGNNKQKGLSYLAIGDMYFTDTDYMKAQAYYDSTLQFLPKEYASYKTVQTKQESLTTLVRYLKIVAGEDSLQKVVKNYGSDTTKLYAYIDKIIDDVKKEEQRKKELQEQGLNPGINAMNPGNTAPGQDPGNSGPLWYFYNPSTVAFGVNEFTRKWGNRKLEDNWRRSNKESMIIIPEEDEKGDTSVVAQNKKKAAKDNKSRDFYLKNLPMTDEALKASDEKIADALYNIGSIYKDQIKNNTKSLAAFEELCSRFPNHKYALPAHFQLYKMYKASNDMKKSDEHKNYILKNHPQSEYANIINNPNYEVNMLAEKEKVSKYYDETYVIYTQKNYPQVITRCNYADSTFGTKNDHAAKFAYLRAVSLGKTQGTPVMEAALVKIIANYPKDPVKDQAQALLDLIRKQRGETTQKTSPTDSLVVKGPAYTVNESGEQQVMLIVDFGKGDQNKFRNSLSDMNNQMYASSGLTISSMILDPKHQLIIVKKFTGQVKALEYFNLLKTRQDILGHLQPGTFDIMVISTENFGLFYTDKNIPAYKTFFENNVLPKK